MNNDIQHLINFRQSLHQNPELSGNEEFTAEALKRMVIRFQPDDIIDNLGGFGVAFVFRSKKEGPTIMFRADMDALPIHEINNIDYASRAEGVGHQCGHDGHMAILVGLAEAVSKNRPEKGKVVLLFQPAEETGEGALAIINDPNFSRIEPDYCFSLHNIPGYNKGEIIVKKGTFAAASEGVKIKLLGKTSHAAEPDKGISPALAMSEIISQLTQLPNNVNCTDYVLATVVHARLGEPTFGTTPGYAEILTTLRAFDDNDLQLLEQATKELVKEACEKYHLQADIQLTDVYPSLQNDAALTSLITEKAQEAMLEVVDPNKVFPWSEDFSQFSQRYKSCFFGLGAGADTPKLHNADYNFPDEIIPTGIELFYRIYEYYLTSCS